MTMCHGDIYQQLNPKKLTIPANLAGIVPRETYKNHSISSETKPL